MTRQASGATKLDFPSCVVPVHADREADKRLVHRHVAGGEIWYLGCKVSVRTTPGSKASLGRLHSEE